MKYYLMGMPDNWNQVCCDCANFKRCFMDSSLCPIVTAIPAHEITESIAQALNQEGVKIFAVEVKK